MISLSLWQTMEHRQFVDVPVPKVRAHSAPPPDTLTGWYRVPSGKTHEEVMHDESYSYIWDRCHNPLARNKARSWYPREPPLDEVIREEMLNTAFELNENIGYNTV